LGILDLFRPPWKQSHWSVRERATKALTDQTLLAEIATTDRDERVRTSAVSNLTDLGLLAKIARSDEHKDVRQAAVKGLTDQTLLAKIAVADRAPEVRACAAAKLADQATLGRVAKMDQDPYVRAAAARKLTDERLLDELATTDKHEVVRQAAGEAREMALGATSPLHKALAEAVVKRTERHIDKAVVLLLCKALQADPKSYVQNICDRAFGGRRVVVARFKVASASQPTVARALELSAPLGMERGEPVKTWEGVGPDGEKVAALFWDAGV
jgi:hypothetical protein